MVTIPRSAWEPTKSVVTTTATPYLKTLSHDLPRSFHRQALNLVDTAIDIWPNRTSQALTSITSIRLIKLATIKPRNEATGMHACTHRHIDVYRIRCNFCGDYILRHREKAGSASFSRFLFSPIHSRPRFQTSCR